MRLNYEEKQLLKQMIIGIIVMAFGAFTVPLCDNDATFCMMLWICAIPYEYICFRFFMKSRIERRLRRIERRQKRCLA